MRTEAIFQKQNLVIKEHGIRHWLRKLIHKYHLRKLAKRMRVELRMPALTRYG